MAAAAADLNVVEDALDLEGSSKGSACRVGKGQQDPLSATGTTALGMTVTTLLGEATAEATAFGPSATDCSDFNGMVTPLDRGSAQPGKSGNSHEKHVAGGIKEADSTSGLGTEPLADVSPDEDNTPSGDEDTVNAGTTGDECGPSLAEEATAREPGCQGEDFIPPVRSCGEEPAPDSSAADRPPTPPQQSAAPPPERASQGAESQRGCGSGLFAPQDPFGRQQSLCPSEPVAVLAIPAEPSEPPPPLVVPREEDGEEEEPEKEVPDLEESKGRVAECFQRLVACFSNAPEAFVTTLVRRPLLSFVVMQVLLGGLCGALFKGGALNTDFDSFVQATSRSSLSRDAYTHAWTVSSFAPRRSRRLSQQDGVSQTYNIVHIIYHQQDGENLLQEERLYAILQFERRLQAMPEWRTACRWDNSPNVTGQASSTVHEMRPSCSPGESLVNYVWPERLASTARSSAGNLDAHVGNTPLRLSGSGARFMPAEVVLAALRDQRSHFDSLRRILPKDFVPPDGGAQARTELLQSHFLFATSYGPEESGVPFRTSSQAHASFDTFLKDTVHPALIDGDEGLEAQGIRVFYHSRALDTLDVFHALWSDCRLALGGLVVVLLIVRLHTQSWILSLVGLLLVLESIPVGYIFFKRFSGLQDMSIVNCLSLFVIIGIGSDLIFVLTDGWRQSATLPSAALRRKASLQGIKALPVIDSMRLSHRKKMLRRRLVWLWGNSGASCVTTTLCSASSFLVNLGSVLAPLREFGLFMGLCVVSSLLLELTMYPLVLMALERSADGSGQRGLVAMSAVVPYAEGIHHEASEQSTSSMRRQGSVQCLKDRSFIVRFLGVGLANFVHSHKRKVFTGFLLFAVVCAVGIPLSISVDSGMPDVFPDSHNQVAGKLFKDRFKSNMVNIANPSINDQAWVCNLTSPRREGNFAECIDTRTSCGTWASVGLCDTSPGVMESYCKRTCGMCEYCFARWCSADQPPQPSRSSLGRCECFEEVAPSSSTLAPLQSNQGEITRIKAMIVGYSADAWRELEPHFTQYFRQLPRAPASWQAQDYEYATVPAAPGEGWRQPPLVQEHWRSGSLSTWPAFEAPTYTVTTRDAATRAPEIVRERVVRQYCYCDGISPCGATRSSRGVVTHPYRPATYAVSKAASGSSRRLDDDALAPPAAVSVEGSMDEEELAEQQLWPAPATPRRLALQAATVNIIYGLEVQDLGPFELFVQTAKEQIWRFDSMFDPADPWAQRSMMQMCESLPASLRVNDAASTSGMWLGDFETWLMQATGESFPSRNFHARVDDFLRVKPEFAKHFLREPGGKVVAVMNEFRLQIAETSGLSAAMDVMKAWDDYVASQNNAASIRAGRAWHTSSLWVRVEAQHGIIASTATIILISVAVGFLAMVFFTRNCLLAVLSMLSVVFIVISLLFVMVTVMQWSIGAIEVVALIVFLGYMFTFNLHIAHSYIHASLGAGGSEWFDEADEASSRRFRMARFAFVSMGQSLLGSATTSVGCSLFLVFCTLQFFVKFGLVILLVTLLSLVYSLLFLPAILMICGPVRRPACCGLDVAPGDSDEAMAATHTHSGEADKIDDPGLADIPTSDGERGLDSDEAKNPATLGGAAEFEGRLSAAEEEEEV